MYMMVLMFGQSLMVTGVTVIMLHAKITPYNNVCVHMKYGDLQWSDQWVQHVYSYYPPLPPSQPLNDFCQINITCVSFTASLIHSCDNITSK